MFCKGSFLLSLLSVLSALVSARQPVSLEFALGLRLRAGAFRALVAPAASGLFVKSWLWCWFPDRCSFPHILNPDPFNEVK